MRRLVSDRGLTAVHRSWRLTFVLALALSLHGCASPAEDGDERQSSSDRTSPSGRVSPPTPPSAGGLMDGMGRVDFPITTNSERAQEYFNQGVAQLYGFWFSEAERSFIEAAKLDPGAAMAYWGIVMTSQGIFVPTYQLALGPPRTLPLVAPENSPEARVRDALFLAYSAFDSITPRERQYIEAVTARHNPREEDPEAAYIAAMQTLVESFPDDLDAKSILALALENGYDRSTKSPRDRTVESLDLLRQVLAENPDHVGANHFLVHALEGSLDLREALPFAERYAMLSPDIPHALHMPGHVYGQIGMFDEAVEAFLATAAKEREYMASNAQYSKMHHLHNEFLFLHVLGLQGNYRDAMSRIADLMSARENPADPEAVQIYRVGWSILVKTLVRFEKWDEILDGTTLPFEEQPVETIWYQWAQGLAYAAKSDAAGARNALMLMDEAVGEVARYVSPVPQQYLIARSELEAYIDASTGDLANGVAGLRRAAQLESEMEYTEPPVYPRPVLELLGSAALNARDFETAESAYLEALGNEPQSGRAFWGLSKAFEGSGNADAAAENFEEYRRVWRGEDLN